MTIVLRNERRRERERMVRDQMRARGVRDERVLLAMTEVPRHCFVPASLQSSAYADDPLPIGEGQTISQPYIVAAMTEALRIRTGDRVLEIGTGSGYQTAVLAELGASVHTVEILPVLAEKARVTLGLLGYAAIRFRTGDGSEGWPSEAPFNAICVTAAPDRIPEVLLEQLAEGGRMIVPVGLTRQDLVFLEKGEGTIRRETLMPVRFVRMTGG
ncbi:protein-L-isoaspartate(D-aspartate) O-methyltransferase [bacterium]|nr:protein-L-isoaspartate(D-aspartate) O-methyltransferase [bacterium]